MMLVGHSLEAMVGVAPLAVHTPEGTFSNHAADANNISTIEQYLEDFWAAEGNFIQRHYRIPKVDGVGSEDLGEHAVAAVAFMEGNKKFLLGDRKYEQKLSCFASKYGIAPDMANTYVWIHEFHHARGITNEEGAERATLVYFQLRANDAQMKGKEGEAEKYQTLADIAKSRIPAARRLDEMRRRGAAKTYSRGHAVETQEQQSYRTLDDFAKAYDITPGEAAQYLSDRQALQMKSKIVSEHEADFALRGIYAMRATQTKHPTERRMYERLASVAQQRLEEGRDAMKHQGNYSGKSLTYNKAHARNSSMSYQGGKAA